MKNTIRKTRFKLVSLEIINKINEIKKKESVFSNPEELKSLIPKDKHHKKGNKAIDIDFRRTLALHANSISFKDQNSKVIKVTAKYPDELKNLIEALM